MLNIIHANKTLSKYKGLLIDFVIIIYLTVFDNYGILLGVNIILEII